MPVKHQAACYRTFEGVRWSNMSDLLSVSMEGAAEAVQKQGFHVKVRTHPDGYKQAFVHPDDLDAAIVAFNKIEAI